MSEKDTGGPAFPVDRQTAHGIAIDDVDTKNEADYMEAVARLSRGMALRDYFAAKAMQGICAGVFPIVKEEDPLPTVARAAYAQADAMLKAREA